MSLEAALEQNTIALNRVADLLEVSNADRAKLIEQSGGTPASSPTPAPSSTSSVPSVADIKEAVKTADEATLKTMLEEEQGGKNRQQAVKAIETALAAFAEDEGKSDAPDAEEADTSTPEPKSNDSAPAADDKNAQPVPAEVSGEGAKAAFANWFKETDEAGERAARRAFIDEVTDKIGGKVSEVDLASRRRAIFYLRRKRGGMAIDYDAAYDFDGSPLQDAPAADDDDGLGL